ncbi:MAG: hypothetical protein Q9166_004783 [cf. Caloplaca sp. 2 TL-2023]
MTSTSTIPTKFLIISDTHNFEFSSTSRSPLQLPTPKTDVLLHCGDLTQIGGLSDFTRALKMLASIPAELKLIIPGNHDLDLDKAYWDKQITAYDNEDEPKDNRPDLQGHGKAVELMTGKTAREAGVTYLTEGTHTFTLTSGATFKIYVSPYTPEFGDWAFGYWNHQDRFNLSSKVERGSTSIVTNPIPEDVDIVMTHGPPKGILDECANGNVGCPNLLRAMKRVRPMMHCFGHIHEGHGVEVVDWKKRAKDAASGSEKGEQKEDWKSKTVYRYFEEDQIENPYPKAFVWDAAQGYRKGETTLAVNASIMTGGYEPMNAPWLVRLDLPRSV